MKLMECVYSLERIGKLVEGEKGEDKYYNTSKESSNNQILPVNSHRLKQVLNLFAPLNHIKQQNSKE